MMKIFRFGLLLLALCFSVGSMAQVNKWQDIYKVKKKDTLFGITKKYGITLPELMDANPVMKTQGYELKKGDTIFIPFAKPKEEQKQTPIQPSSTRKSTDPVRIGVMLPLHNVDGDGKRMVEYYRGILMACDYLKKHGVSTDVHAWNVPIDADIRTTLLQEGASQCDLIFGPLYTKQVAPLSEFCKNNGIKLVIPFSISGDDVERSKEIFQVYQSQESLNNATVKAFLKRFTNVHPIFIDCNDSTSRKGAFTFGLRKELEKRNINFSITNVNSSIEQFAKAFVPSKQNVVILNTGRSPQLTAVLNKLDEFDAKYPGASISLFGYTEWLMYAKYNLERFYKYDTYIPSTFYYNASNVRTQSLETSYQRWFHQPMQVALPRFAITGYDHAMFFIQGVKKEGRNFTGDSKHSTYQPVQTPLDFEKTGLKGGYKNKSFMLIHYTFNHQIEAVKY